MSETPEVYGNNQRQIRAKIQHAAEQLSREWYLIDEPGYEIQVATITPLVGPLYQVTLTLVVWTTFSSQALFLDGEHPSLFIDTSLLHSLLTGPLFRTYNLDHQT